MAVETTPLGFKKPDNTELVKFGAYAITLNAQRSEELLQGHNTRLANMEAAAFEAGATPLIEDPDDPGFYIVGASPTP